MSRMVAGDCVVGSGRPVGREGGGIAMAEGFELAVLLGARSRSRGWARTEGASGIERSSSSRAAAMMKGQRDQRDVIDFLGRPSGAGPLLTVPGFSFLWGLCFSFCFSPDRFLR